MEVDFIGLLLMPLHILAGYICFQSIFPFLPIASSSIASADHNTRSLHILIHNVYQYNENYQSVIDMIREENPDVILLLETGHEWDQHLKILYDDYPNQVKEIKDDTYGIIMLSKTTTSEKSVNHQTDQDIPSTELLLDMYNRKIRIIGIHPEPPVPGEVLTSLPKEKELLASARYIESLPDDELHVLIGDLNDVAWSNVAKRLKQITGLKDPRKGRGFFSTFPTYSFIKIPLDHVFCSAEFTLIEFKTLEQRGSDHLPVSVKLQVPLSHTHSQE